MKEAIDFAELKASGALPTPKGVMLKVMRLCQREQVALHELARTISADPALAGQVIRIANAVNPVRSRPIASVSKDALILIGIHSVRQLVLGLSMASTYRSGACVAFDYEKFWAQSIAMACAAQGIGANLRVVPLAELFACGLLAGVGRLALASARPLSYSNLLIEIEGKTLEEQAAAEAALFSFNHLTLTAAMMNDWNIPRLFSDAVLFHESPDKSRFARGSRQDLLVQVLHLARLIASLCLADEAAQEQLMAAVQAQATRIGIDAQRVPGLVAGVMTDWAEWGKTLHLKVRVKEHLRWPA